jgi:hypothetical protein
VVVVSTTVLVVVDGAVVAVTVEAGAVIEVVVGVEAVSAPLQAGRARITAAASNRRTTRP